MNQVTREEPVVEQQASLEAFINVTMQFHTLTVSFSTDEHCKLFDYMQRRISLPLNTVVQEVSCSTETDKFGSFGTLKIIDCMLQASYSYCTASM